MVCFDHVRILKETTVTHSDMLWNLIIRFTKCVGRSTDTPRCDFSSSLSYLFNFNIFYNHTFSIHRIIVMFSFPFSTFEGVENYACVLLWNMLITLFVVNVNAPDVFVLFKVFAEAYLKTQKKLFVSPRFSLPYFISKVTSQNIRHQTVQVYSITIEFVFCHTP